jgi:hypothetical protein
MAPLLHRVVLKDVDYKSGEYPVVLQDATSLLLEEQKNFVPTYMPGGMMNFLEARVMAAEQEGLIEGLEEGIKVRQEIEAFKGQINSMVRHMGKEWGSAYAKGISWSNDAYSSEPAITKPENPGFSFQFRPKTFDLGLTGRLLKDEQGNILQEKLELECDIYDAYELALLLSPKRVLAVNSNGSQTTIYEDYKNIGKNERLEKPKEEIFYVFSEDQFHHYNAEPQVLPTDGLKVVFSDFYEKIRKYERGAMLFGHKYSSANEFLEMVTVLNDHLIWDMCAYDRGSAEYGGNDAALIDCEKSSGLIAGNGKGMPENKNRLQLISSRTKLYFNRVSLHFDKATAIQALMSLGDTVTDIWMEPVDRKWDRGWDIVYDMRRSIKPDKVVPVLSAVDAERYYVLKDFKHKLNDKPNEV